MQEQILIHEGDQKCKMKNLILSKWTEKMI